MKEISSDGLRGPLLHQLFIYFVLRSLFPAHGQSQQTNSPHQISISFAVVGSNPYGLQASELRKPLFSSTTSALYTR